jgi:hypothetical protein
MFNIPNLHEKSKRFLRLLTQKDIYIGLVILFVGSASFGLGTLAKAKNEQTELKIYDLFPEFITTSGGVSSFQSASVVQAGAFVASKSGTKYHLPWCSSAGRIKEENKIWFQTKEEAEKAGYTPASNCPGL